MRQLPLDGRPAGIAELTAALAAALDGSGPAVLPLDATAPDLAVALRPDEPIEPDVAVIIATSGSTGAAKGVLLSASALRASAEATHARLGGPGRWLLATPAQYIGGLQVLVRSLLGGTTPAVVDLSVPFRPDTFAEAARPLLAGSGPRYTAMVPTQLTRLLAASEGSEGLAALRAFDAVIIGAAATTAALRERAEAAGVRVVPAYGMSETASGCVYDGVPLDGVRLRLAGESGGVGRIQLSGPVLANGYRLRPDLTAAAFQDGWFTTGDAGRLRDGRLEVVGRVDDLINTGGVKVAPALVERILTGCAGVAEACVTWLPDEHWGQVVAAMVVARDGAEPDPDALREAVRAQAGRAAVPKLLRFTDRIPLRGPGKPDRAAIRDLLRE
jgi:O-succinylbenzoic acid--CoA ligase